MSGETVKLLSEFESLPVLEKREFLQELLRRDRMVDLRERGLDKAHAANLRARLATFAEDWERPEMSIYDES
jgi:hypothetical protein